MDTAARPAPPPPRRGRAALGLIVTTLLLPLLGAGIGVWEMRRGAADVEFLALEQARAAKVVAMLEARPAPATGIDSGARFQRNGRTYVGPIALSQAREALEAVEGAQAVAGVRRHLPAAVVLCFGLAAALSAFALLGAALLGRAGRASREALARGFSAVRRVLPALLGAQVVLVAIGFVAMVAFESLAILEAGDLSSGGAKLLGIALVAVGFSLWTAVNAVIGLRRAMGLFTPDPLPVHGRLVPREAAPGLWALVDGLADRLGALRPDHVVAGLTGGFFVASGPKVLEPGGTPLNGRTLYLPLPLLPLLRPDETAAIIGHELAHFSGGDTEYSLRFLPIYAGVGRSLDAVLLAGMGGDGKASPLTRPALRLGSFAMERFHHAVRHWSRQREFAADAAGAGATSADAAARALLRTGAAQPRVDEVLSAAFRDPGAMPEELVEAVLEHAARHGLDDPACHLEDAQPHPTDTHPPTRQRLAALGRQPDAALLAEAAAVPTPEEARARLEALFAEPGALCRAASRDLLGEAQAALQAEHAALQEAASGVAEAPVILHENTRGGGIFLIGFGAVLAAMALGVVALDGLGRSATGANAVILLAGGGLALAFLLGGWWMLRRGRTPFLTLTPDSMRIAGLDRAIPWAEVADLDMTQDRGRVVTRVLLPPGAPFPGREKGGRRPKLAPKRRIVTFSAAPPRGMTVQGFAELVASYRRAEAARRILAAGNPPGEAPRMAPGMAPGMAPDTAPGMAPLPPS